MEIPNRIELDASFTRRLTRLSSRQRRRLIQLMGTPPNPASVPPSFWEEIEREAREEVEAVLLLLFVAAATSHGVTRQQLGNQPRQYASIASVDMAGRWAGGARERFRRQAELITTGEVRTKEDVQQGAVVVLGPAAARRAAETVITQTQTVGGDAAARMTFGLSELDVWAVRPELTRSGPCPRCQALDGKPRSEWGRIDADARRGPPIHDHCACEVEYHNMTVDTTPSRN